ncbi:MAG: type II secretion system protein [Ilumatobacteraceae bacterium]
MSRRTKHQESRSSRDRGFSLVEIVISIVLLGTVVVAGLNAVTTNIKVSSTSRSAAQVETAIVNASDRVNRAKKSCDYTKYARAAVQTEGWDPNTATVTQQYYVPSGDPQSLGTWAVGPTAGPGCRDGVLSDLLVQRVNITITSPDGKVRRSITVVKSDV